ncbi:MAG: sporulation protein YqfC [Thermoanaerobacterales bacterium]|nr:sporulation protein YqfC [Thermoanaerobacterales bacterium]
MNQELRRRMSDMLDLPRDIVLNLPRIVITGRLAVFIENHKGIVEYSPEVVRINTAIGVIAVKGQRLFIKSILSDEITVEGEIQTIQFED